MIYGGQQGRRNFLFLIQHSAFSIVFLSLHLAIFPIMRYYIFCNKMCRISVKIFAALRNIFAVPIVYIG